MTGKSLFDKISIGKISYGKVSAGITSRGLDLNRQQMISVLLAFGIVAASIVSVALVFTSRADALAELTDHQDQLARLQAAYAQRAKSGKGVMVERDAPESAFLAATTVALAGAQLQTRLTDLVALQKANISSAGIQKTSHDDADVVRLQATFDMKLTALQKLLYDLETGTPYMFIDALSIQPQGNAPRSTEEPLLHVTMTLRAIWRKTSL